MGGCSVDRSCLSMRQVRRALPEGVDWLSSISVGDELPFGATENKLLIASGESARSPSRRGRFASLRPIRPADIPMLYILLTDENVGARWRFRGVVPRRDQFEQILWEGVHAQFVVESSEGGELIGLASAYNASLNAGTVNMGIAITDHLSLRGYGIEAFILLARYLFATWSFRKLYAYMPAFNRHQIESSIGRYMHVEGILRDHEYYGHRYWDTFILAFYRSDLAAFDRDHPRLRMLSEGSARH
jgi:RimJ/RimL family protein N-acetyltransferase